MGAIGKTHRARGAGNFLHGDRMRDIPQSRAAIFLICGDAKQAKLAELRPEIAREQIFLVDFGGARRQPVLGPAGDHVAHFLDHRVEVELHESV